MAVPDTFFCEDAAVQIADLYLQEEDKYNSSDRTRDKHRAETSMRAYKEALRWVLLEQQCSHFGGPVAMPDVERYLRERNTPTT
jgi:PAB1-binding protein PBP1